MSQVYQAVISSNDLVGWSLPAPTNIISISAIYSGSVNQLMSSIMTFNATGYTNPADERMTIQTILDSNLIFLAHPPDFTITPTIIVPAPTMAASTTETSPINVPIITTSIDVAAVQMTFVNLSLPMVSTNISAASSQTESTTTIQNQSTSSTRAITSDPEVSSRTSHGSSLPTGALAGAVVGCALAALLVAVMVVFLCLKRRRRRSKKSVHASKQAVRSLGTDEQSFRLVAGTKANWQKDFPQSESDQTVISLANRTLDDIELFVENYYTDRLATQTSDPVASNLSLFDTPYLGQPLIDLLESSTSPTVLLKHCIAFYLLPKIDPTRNTPSSLLPREFAVPSQGDSQALSQVRVRTAHSHPNIDQDKDYLVRRDQAAQIIIHQIERAFQPWTRGTLEDRVKNLNGILIHLSQLGNSLFSQPAIFEWRWSETSTLDWGQIVMLPGLDKMTDARSVTLKRPICLVKPRLSSSA